MTFTILLKIEENDRERENDDENTAFMQSEQFQMMLLIPTKIDRFLSDLKMPMYIVQCTS